jgi:hypothetical protein
MRLKFKVLSFMILLSMLLVLPILVNNASAQTQSNYYVTVKPVNNDALIYTSIGLNATLSFQASWSYGSDEGQNIQNATVSIQVSNSNNKVINNLSVNSTSGIFSFNYSSANPEILTFTPNDLTAQDGRGWNSSIVDSANSVSGFTSQSAQVWWDTFHVSLVNSDTNSLGKVGISVNVTYLLLPEEGLQVGSVHVSKTVQNANVTVNGVTAQESQTPGIYLANSSTIFPTAYVNVEVSQKGWTSTDTGFNFVHNSNQTAWIYAVVLGSAFTVAVVALYFFRFKRINPPSLFRHSSFPIFGGVLLAATSVVSLYWGLVGLEGSLHAFNWLPLAILGVLSFAFGIVGSIMSLKRKNQALAIFAVIVPMFTNIVGVKASLDMYQLTNPWLIFLVSMLLSVISGYFITNSDENFQRNNSKENVLP